jgi:phosphoenolpyruvate carboxylase
MTSTELFWKVVDQTIRLAELTSLEGGMREAPPCLLENNAPLALSLQLRTPYVDPLSLIQIELLRRKRRGERRTELCSGRHHRRYLSRVEEYGLVIKMKKAGFFE